MYAIRDKELLLDSDTQCLKCLSAQLHEHPLDINEEIVYKDVRVCELCGFDETTSEELEIQYG